MMAIVLVAVIWKKGELPNSISDIVFDLPSKYQWLWTVWIWLMIAGVTPSLFEAMKDSPYQFIGFLTVACLLFVGAWPLFNKDTIKSHNIGAILGGVFSQLCVLIINPCWLLLWFIVVVLGFNNKMPKFLEGKGILLYELVSILALVLAILVR